MLKKATNLMVAALLATSVNASSEELLVHHAATSTSIDKGQQIWLAATTEAENAQAKIVVKKKRKSGGTTYVTFNVVFENLPQGLYSYCFWHSRLMGDGAPPDCGEPVPPGTQFTAVIGGEKQPMCCPGCQAVAQLIAGSGLESFYRLRTELNETAPPLPPDNLYLAYDDPANCADFVTRLEDGRQRAQLLLGGISCAACTWLIEKALLATPGVSAANVNLSRQSLVVELLDTFAVATAQDVHQVIHAEALSGPVHR